MTTRFAKQPDWSHALLRGERISTVTVYGCLLAWRPFHSDADGRPSVVASPARSVIADQTGFTWRTVARATARLVELGLIRKRHQGRGRAQLYVLAWDAPFDQAYDWSAVLMMALNGHSAKRGQKVTKGDTAPADDTEKVTAVSPFPPKKVTHVSPHRESSSENTSTRLLSNGYQRAREVSDGEAARKPADVRQTGRPAADSSPSPVAIRPQRDRRRRDLDPNVKAVLRQARPVVDAGLNIADPRVIANVTSLLGLGWQPDQLGAWLVDASGGDPTVAADLLCTRPDPVPSVPLPQPKDAATGEAAQTDPAPVAVGAPDGLTATDAPRPLGNGSKPAKRRTARLSAAELAKLDAEIARAAAAVPELLRVATGTEG